MRAPNKSADIALLASYSIPQPFSQSLTLTFYFLHLPSIVPLNLPISLLLSRLSLSLSPSLHFSHMLSSVFFIFSHRHNGEILTMCDLSTSGCCQCANKAIHTLPTPTEFIAENILNAHDVIHFPVLPTAELPRSNPLFLSTL